MSEIKTQIAELTVKEKHLIDAIFNSNEKIAKLEREIAALKYVLDAQQEKLSKNEEALRLHRKKMKDGI